MKKQGYYDLLINEFDDSFRTKKIDEIKNVDDWLMTQISFSIKEELNSLNSIEEKIKYLSKINNKIGNDSKQLIGIGVNATSQNHLSQLSFHSEPIYKEIIDEINTCDEVHIVTAFTSREMINQLRTHIINNPKLKLKFITSLYDGKSNVHALDSLFDLTQDFLGRVEVRVQNSFSPHFKNSLHAKSYNFIRKSGFGTLYIGSSNFSQNGLSNYKEFNVKLSEFSNAKSYHEYEEEFEKLFYSNDMVNPNDYRNFEEMKLKAYLKLKSHKWVKVENDEFEKSSLMNKRIEFYLKQHQIEALKAIEDATIQNKNKHLLVMATGTGKTVTIGFRILEIYKKIDSIPTVLFVAPRKEILDQSFKTFKSILELEDIDFQKNYDGNKLNNAKMDSHIILGTNQSLKNNLELLSKVKFDLVVFDEAHHVEADTLQKIYDAIKIKANEIIGLTATPERTDGVHIMKYFDNEVRYELPLFNAVDNQILSDFDYYFIDDESVDEINFDLSKAKSVDLDKILNTTTRNKFVKNTINKYISKDDENVKALLFCSSVEHALGVSKYLNDFGFKSNTISSKTWDDNFMNKVDLSSIRRSEIQKKFEDGEINFLTTVDMFSEGVDIPKINKVLFLRPTESKIIYLQQLGRGLRKYGEKRLEVFDFVNNINLDINKNYNPLSFIQCINSNFNSKDLVDSGMNFGMYSPGNSIFNFTKASIEKIRLQIEKKKTIFNQINIKTIENYRERKVDDYEKYKSYFIDQNINIYSFYVKHKYIFFKSNYKSDRLKFPSLSLLNNKAVIEEIINSLESKNVSNNELINLYLITNYFVFSEESSKKYNSNLLIQNLFNYLIKDDQFVSEALCLLKFKLEFENFKYFVISDNIESWKGTYINNKVMAVMLSKNLHKYLMNSMFVKSFNVLSPGNYGMSKINESEINEHDHGYVNHFDYYKKILTCDTEPTWNSDKKTNSQIKFESKMLKVAFLYKAKKILDEYNLTIIKKINELPVHEFLGFKEKILDQVITNNNSNQLILKILIK